MTTQHTPKETIAILHGSDGKWHLWDNVCNEAMDWPPLATKEEAESDRRDFYRSDRELAAVERSELILSEEAR